MNAAIPNWWEHPDLPSVAAHEAGHAVHAAVHRLPTSIAMLYPLGDDVNDGAPGGAVPVRHAEPSDLDDTIESRVALQLAIDNTLAGPAAEILIGSERGWRQIQTHRSEALPLRLRLDPTLSRQTAHQHLQDRVDVVVYELAQYRAAIDAVAAALLAAPVESIRRKIGDRQVSELKQVGGRTVLELVRSSLGFAVEIEQRGTKELDGEIYPMYVFNDIER